MTYWSQTFSWSLMPMSQNCPASCQHKCHMTGRPLTPSQNSQSLPFLLLPIPTQSLNPTMLDLRAHILAWLTPIRPAALRGCFTIALTSSLNSLSHLVIFWITYDYVSFRRRGTRLFLKACYSQWALLQQMGIIHFYLDVKHYRKNTR